MPQLCLDSIETVFNYTAANIEVIVVDNNSQDNSKQTILNKYPQVKWIQMGYNSGFARANNAGIKKSKGDIVLLLNSDTINENDAIFKCFRRFEESEYVACGIQLLNSDRTPQISGNYFLTGGLNYLMALPYWGRLVRWVGINFGVKKTNIPEATNEIEVDWISGAFLMVKKTTIKKAGLMDEDFFLYSEESEWCSRLSKFGKQCIYGDLNIVHLEGGTSSNAFESKTRGYQVLSDRKGFQIMISNFLRFRKQHGVFWYLFHLFANLFTIPIFFLATTIRTLLFLVSIKEWKEFWGYSTNVLGSLKYTIRILRNRPYFYKVL